MLEVKLKLNTTPINTNINRWIIASSFTMRSGFFSSLYSFCSNFQALVNTFHLSEAVSVFSAKTSNEIIYLILTPKSQNSHWYFGEGVREYLQECLKDSKSYPAEQEDDHWTVALHSEQWLLLSVSFSSNHGTRLLKFQQAETLLPQTYGHTQIVV